jgi:hypothetical protein
MTRLTMTGALISAALGSVLVLPVAAQAAPSAPAAGISRMAVSAAVPNIPPVVWEFYGTTYPDTSAGLAACNAEGSYLHQQNSRVITWSCELGNPNSGLYNLWYLYNTIIE